jgi:prevent-host-death family protein
MKVSVYEAKSKLSQMINRALDGEEVVITRNGEATVKLVPVRSSVSDKSWIGSWKGKAKIHDKFYNSLDDDETVRYLTGELSTPLPE